MRTWIISCFLLSYITADGDFDGIGGGENTANDACPDGTMDNGYGGCEQCNPGMFENMLTGICEYCPYDYYSATAGSTHCTACPTGTTTQEIGSNSESDCTVQAKCEIPETVASFYVGTEHNILMNVGDRVLGGSQLTFMCSEDNHVVTSTTFNFLNIYCTSTTALELPTACVKDPTIDECSFPENAGSAACGGSSGDSSGNNNGVLPAVLSGTALITSVMILCL